MPICERYEKLPLVPVIPVLIELRRVCCRCCTAKFPNNTPVSPDSGSSANYAFKYKESSLYSSTKSETLLVIASVSVEREIVPEPAD